MNHVRWLLNFKKTQKMINKNKVNICNDHLTNKNKIEIKSVR